MVKGYQPIELQPLHTMHFYSMKGLCIVSIYFPVFCWVINKCFDAIDSSSYLKLLLNLIYSNVDLLIAYPNLLGKKGYVVVVVVVDLFEILSGHLVSSYLCARCRNFSSEFKLTP